MNFWKFVIIQRAIHYQLLNHSVDVARQTLEFKQVGVMCHNLDKSDDDGIAAIKKPHQLVRPQ
jgi:hypothetical protein